MRPVLDDGAGAGDLPGLPLPDLALPSTSGAEVVLSSLGPRTVLYLYPVPQRGAGRAV